MCVCYVHSLLYILICAYTLNIYSQAKLFSFLFHMEIKRKFLTVHVWFGARDRKFWWEHLLHIFACMHTYYNLCVRDIPLLEQKNHTIFMYQKKKDKKQLVSKRDGAQSNNPVLQCLNFGCTHGVRKPSTLPLGTIHLRRRQIFSYY